MRGQLSVLLIGRLIVAVKQKPRAAQKKADERKLRIVNVRVTTAEYDAIQSAAEKAKMTASAFFRSLILDGAGVRPVFNSDDRLALGVLHDDMRKIGINLNQVARALNSGRVVHPEEVLIAVRNVHLAAVGVSVELRDAAMRSGNRRRGVE